MIRRWAMSLAVLGLLTGAVHWSEFPARASSFRIVPTRLDLNMRTGTGVFKLDNGDDKPVTVQFYAVKWSQDSSGKDKTERTPDILIFPRQVTLDKGAGRVVRIGYRGKRGGDRELTYRLIAEELPTNVPGKQSMLRFLLRLSVPIFVPAREDRVAWDIASVHLSQGDAEVIVKNQGNRHIVVDDIAVSGYGASGNKLFDQKGTGWYVLPGISKSFPVSIPVKDCEEVRKLIATVSVDGKSKQSQATLTPDASKCRKSK